MERPYNRNPRFFEVSKKNGVVEIIAMNIMKMDDIRPNGFDIPDKPLGGDVRHEPLVVE